MANEGNLIYRSGSGADAWKICYKASGADAGNLCYKATPGGWTTVTFAWGSDGKDLDICAYWVGAPDMTRGYDNNSTTAEGTTGVYKIRFSGDMKGVDDAEWVKIIKTKWSEGSREFRVHFNYYGYNSTTYPANTCTVIAIQENGPSKILRDVPCSTVGAPNARGANKGDPGVKIMFSEEGTLQSMETI